MLTNDCSTQSVIAMIAVSFALLKGCHTFVNSITFQNISDDKFAG